jgi:hypothetical protein
MKALRPKRDIVPHPKSEVASVQYMRVETILRKYPMHVLQSQGSDAKEIVIRDMDDEGNEIMRWRVLFTAPEGAPGPLAYRVDRIIIDKCLDEQGRDGIPKMLRLGTLKEMCDALGISKTGPNAKNIQNALMQLAGTDIEIDGDALTRFPRYQWIRFTGTKLPDDNGTRADAVYIGLSDPYQAILKNAVRRPLDCNYIRDLPPASARLYEIISSRVFAAFSKGGKQPEARILYSEFCQLSALTRYVDRRKMYTQMYKLHLPHTKSRYIYSVSYEDRRDGQGRPDWMMVYVPGEKARTDYVYATSKKGRGVTAEVLPFAQEPLNLPNVDLTPTQKLTQVLASAGVEQLTAQVLVEKHPDASKKWADIFSRGEIVGKKNMGGFLVKAITNNYAAPEAAQKVSKPKAIQSGVLKSKPLKKQSEDDAALMEIDRRIEAALNEDWEQVELDALERASAGDRKILSGVPHGGSLYREIIKKILREGRER